MTVVHLINVTLDGRCGHADVIADDPLHDHAFATIEPADVVLFGAGTYRLLAPHWSEIAANRSGSGAENRFAEMLRSKPKIPFSRHIDPWPNWNTTVDRGDPVFSVRRLLEGGTKHLVVQASPRLASTLRSAGMVDEMRVLLQPIVAGTGPHLFDDHERHDKLHLRQQWATSAGAVALDYVLPT